MTNLAQSSVSSASTTYRELVLIPPLSPDFSVYGDKGTNARARDWALSHRLMLADNCGCAHDLYLMYCPNAGGRCLEGFDHTQLWVPYDKPWKPFLLTQPYKDEIPQELADYAGAHGLDIGSYDSDGWYSSSTIPVRLAARSGLVCWPLGSLAQVMIAAYPVDWPDPDETADWHPDSSWSE